MISLSRSNLMCRSRKLDDDKNSSGSKRSTAKRIRNANKHTAWIAQVRKISDYRID